MKLSDKTYKILEYVARIVLPALGTLYFAVASIWNLPYATEVVGTIVAVDVFLGALLGIAMKNYDATAKYAGAIDVTTDKSGKTIFSLQLNGQPEDLLTLPNANFKVNTPSS